VALRIDARAEPAALVGTGVDQVSPSEEAERRGHRDEEMDDEERRVPGAEPLEEAGRLVAEEIADPAPHERDEERRERQRERGHEQEEHRRNLQCAVHRAPTVAAGGSSRRRRRLLHGRKYVRNRDESSGQLPCGGANTFLRIRATKS
jgi:hypothetical protein